MRQRFIAQDWGRRYVNVPVDRVRRVVAWGVGEELLPGSQARALREVKGLRLGDDGVRELPPVKPVPMEHVEAVLPHLPPMVAAMVQLQLLTGYRPNEVCIMRMRDLDMSGPVWTYRPHTHKTSWHGHDRRVQIGPRAQELMRPYLRTELDAYLFQPLESERRRNQEKRANRTTKLWPSHVKSA